MSKVAIITCVDYDRERVFAAVKKAVDLVGGMEAYVKPGMRVLLKPNLLSARVPEEAVDTHPEVVRAVARLAIAAGGRVRLGDSPGGYGKNIDEIFEKSGMQAMAREEGVELAKFTSSKFVKGFPIARQVLDSDLVISIPKLKTHSITVLTVAVKNTYGCVTGLFKAECHSRAPREEDFARVIATVHSIVRPGLSIVDGITGMEGDGPAAGRPRQIGLVMAGPDAVAIDACVARLVGLEPFDVRVTKEAYAMGLGEARLSAIEVVGESLESAAIKHFRLPQTTALGLIPRALVNKLARFIRFKPVIDVPACKRCNLCKITCPVAAITIDEKACAIDYRKCVKCLCCHEVCPYKAIYIRRNFLTKMVWG